MALIITLMSAEADAAPKCMFPQGFCLPMPEIVIRCTRSLRRPQILRVDDDIDLLHPSALCEWPKLPAKAGCNFAVHWDDES